MEQSRSPRCTTLPCLSASTCRGQQRAAAELIGRCGGRLNRLVPAGASQHAWSSLLALPCSLLTHVHEHAALQTWSRQPEQSKQPEQHPPGTRCGAGSSHTAPGTRCRCRKRPQPPAAPASAAAGTRTRPAARQGRTGEEGCVRQWGWEAQGRLQHGSVLALLLASPAVPAAPPHTCARRMPRPPPPAVALIMIGKPIWLATCAKIVGAMPVGPVWLLTHGLMHQLCGGWRPQQRHATARPMPKLPASAAAAASCTSLLRPQSQPHLHRVLGVLDQALGAGHGGHARRLQGTGTVPAAVASRVTPACDSKPIAAAAAASRAVAALAQHAQHAQHKAVRRPPSWCRERWTCRP